MIKNTFELRKTQGKFETLESDATDKRRNHVSVCEACGSNKPESLYGVKSSSGMILLVGVKCLSILISGKNPKVDSILENSGEVYNDGNREVIYITEEWINRVFEYNVISVYAESKQPKHIRNQFIHSVYQNAKQYKKISVKQYEAVNKIISQ